MLAKKHIINPNDWRRPGKSVKSPKQMERHLKGVANHWRIEILFLVANNKGITVEDIAERLNCNFKTISEHTRKLDQTGLIRKKYKGRTVTHELSPYGQNFYKFIRTFQHS
ncbi:MAG: winged helix-turn-helix domain-containing protein [Candidatus Moranbacteria bacterium]|nr:winged helix-turn-helix domain-containing protein [Candidatus Moranbacteria bacterium]